MQQNVSPAHKLYVTYDYVTEETVSLQTPDADLVGIGHTVLQ